MPSRSRTAKDENRTSATDALPATFHGSERTPTLAADQPFACGGGGSAQPSRQAQLAPVPRAMNALGGDAVALPSAQGQRIRMVARKARAGAYPRPAPQVRGGGGACGRPVFRADRGRLRPPSPCPGPCVVSVVAWCEALLLRDIGYPSGHREIAFFDVIREL